ncbi:hypothetical protein FF1_019367 [Malus domestica]
MRKAIGSTGFDYEPSPSYDFSDSEEETSPITESEGQRADRVNKQDSSLLRILDSWYSNKNGESSEHKSENVDRTVDSTMSLAIWIRHHGQDFFGRPCSLKKSSDPRMES